MLNQRSATVNVLLSVFNESGNEYVLNGEVNLKDVITPDQKQKTKQILFTMFREGKITYKPEFEAKVQDDSELNKYIGGLINNWLRKAKELNNGEKYEAQNPGSRAGSGDPQVRELKKLLAKVKGTTHEAKVQAAIAERLEEIKPKVEINTDLIPESLQGLV
jgi:hypothetical protein